METGLIGDAAPEPGMLRHDDFSSDCGEVLVPFPNDRAECRFWKRRRLRCRTTKNQTASSARTRRMPPPTAPPIINTKVLGLVGSQWRAHIALGERPRSASPGDIWYSDKGVVDSQHLAGGHVRDS